MRPTWAPVRNAIRTASTARGIRAVSESADATALAAINPVQRPASFASAREAVAGIYVRDCSSNHLASVSLESENRRGFTIPDKVNQLREAD
jgi:hypothetical protein